MTRKINYEKSSGNIFKDLGFVEPELEELKAQLALQVFKAIKTHKLNQTQAAKVLGIDQPEISNLKLGKYSRFKVERLFNFLNRLNLNIDIMISKAKRGQPRQRIVEQKSNHNSSGV
ncbi:MAG: helix-turn-helix transcriptional regulator [Gammaproteobacteria bacterium]|jgi:predicted XRE-type DNA-binding protein